MAEKCSALRDLEIRLLTLAAAMAVGLICPAFASDATDLNGGDAPEGLYRIAADLPQEVLRDVVVTLELPAGLILDDKCIMISGSSTTALVNVSEPNDGTCETLITWSFGKVDNSLDKDILIRFKLVASNASSNQNGAKIGPCRASLRFDNIQGLSQSTIGESEPVLIVEPDLWVEKRATTFINDDGTARITYKVELRHTPLSCSSAFDVDVIDSIPSGLALYPGSVGIVSGPPGGRMEVIDSSSLKWHFDEIDLSWSEGQDIVLRYEAFFDEDSLATPSRAGSYDEIDRESARGRLDWTSAPGENPDERSYAFLFDESECELSVSIKTSPENPEVGEVLTCTYVVRNTGKGDISNLTLVAGRPGQMREVSLNKCFLSQGEEVVAVANRRVTETDFPSFQENALALGEDRLGNQVVDIGRISIDPLGFFVIKTADRKTVKPGETLNYTISLWNRGSVSVENVTVRDVFDRKVDILYTDPTPDPDGVWRFSQIESGFTNITLKVKVPETQDFEFRMDQGVSGDGFINVANDYTTARPTYKLTNHVYVTFSLEDKTRNISESETVTVTGTTGTELSTREHGSGQYNSEEQIKLFTEKKSISMDKDVSATYGTTTLGLYRNRSVTYSSRWTEEVVAKNRISGTSLSESYRYATFVDRESLIKLDENESMMEVNTEFDGMGHIAILKMPSANTTAHDKPSFESREDYTGSFKILVDTDGSKSSKVSTGTGFVAADKRIGSAQRSYESGTGNYSSEEEIDATSNYIAKDISLEYGPKSQSLTDDSSLNQSLRWKEGMWSRNLGTSFIGEEYTGTTQLDKETVARGLNEMETEANFLGKARFRSILEDMIDSDEEYEGEYSIQRKTILKGVSKYNRPHLNVAKEGSFYEEKVIENLLEKTITVASYTITVENDGNRTLGPIYVTDFFPPRAKFINASVRPSEQTSSKADWVLTHLAIGDRLTIVLNLDVTEYRGDELVNRVEACGVYEDEQICAANFTALEIVWLKCCPQDNLSVSKTAWLDETRPNVVWYRIVIQNSADATRVATVTDDLPEGMTLLDSAVPFSSYDGGVVTWNLIDIGPRENKTIDYRAEALWSGRFENQVRVDARSVDGAATSPVYAASVITLEGFEGEIPKTGWQPPYRDLSRVENSTYFEMCEEIFL